MRRQFISLRRWPNGVEELPARVLLPCLGRFLGLEALSNSAAFSDCSRHSKHLSMYGAGSFSCSVSCISRLLKRLRRCLGFELMARLVMVC